MSEYGTNLAAFQKAIMGNDAEGALEAARAMGKLGLYDSLSLCRVLALAKDPLYERCARRWLVLLANEDRRTLSDVLIGAAALGALSMDASSERAWEALEGLVRAR